MAGWLAGWPTLSAVAPKKVGEERGDEMAERIIYTEDEHFSLALHFSKR